MLSKLNSKSSLFILLILILVGTFFINKQQTSILKEAQRIFNTCTNTDREKCYKEEFTKLTEAKDIFFAEQTLYALQELDPIVRHCHVLSHEISRVATRKNPAKWRELIDKVNPNTCGAGFLHGVLEAHIGDDPDFRIDASVINDICGKEGKDFKERTCAHILGHLVMVDNDANMERSLDICSGLQDRQMLKECYTGVFMEDSFKTNLVDHGLAEIPVRDKQRMEAQRERCLKYSDVAGVACWIDLAEIFAEYYNYDPQITYRSCYQAPEKEAQVECYFKAVVLIAVSPSFDDSENLLEICQPYSEDKNFYSRCTNFIISSLMYYSPKFSDRGVKLCSNIADSYKEYCFQTLGEKLKMNVTERAARQEFCSGTPSRYLQFCVN